MYKRSYFSDSEKIDKLLKKKIYKYPKPQGDEDNNQNKTPKNRIIKSYTIVGSIGQNDIL